MYKILIRDHNHMISMQHFKTREECMQATLEQVGDFKYKIYEPNEEIIFLEARRWDEEKEDFIVDKEIIKNQKLFLLEQSAGFFLKKLDSLFLIALQQEDEILLNNVKKLRKQCLDIKNIKLPETEIEIENFVPDFFVATHVLARTFNLED